jgi:hypothetical protein
MLDVATQSIMHYTDIINTTIIAITMTTIAIVIVMRVCDAMRIKALAHCSRVFG